MTRKTSVGWNAAHEQRDRDRGDWFQTYTGREFHLLDPSEDEICLEDIAHGLALQCRFNGHTRTFYSVAQHSVLVARCVTEVLGETNVRILRTALLHDAAEAYIGDMVKPLKATDVHFRQVEARIEEIIARVFSLAWPFPPIVRLADNALLIAERNALMAAPPRPWTVREPPWQGAIVPWSPAQAERVFLQQAHEYLCKGAAAALTAAQTTTNQKGTPDGKDTRQ